METIRVAAFVGSLSCLLAACSPAPREAGPPSSEVESIDQAVTIGGSCKGSATACLDNHTLAACKKGRYQKVPCGDRCFPDWDHEGKAVCGSCIGGGEPQPCTCPAFEDQIATPCSAITGLDEQQLCGKQCVGDVCINQSGRNEPLPFFCKSF